VTLLQELPDDVAEALCRLHREALGSVTAAERAAARSRLAGYADRLVGAGWRRSTLARALGVTRQGIAHIAGSAVPACPGPDLPVPAPTSRPPRPAGPSRRRLSPEQVAVLSGLRDRSSRLYGPVAGTAREQTPAGRASREFAERVDALCREGHTIYGIATDLGMAYGAVHTRLARHGLREFSPSQAPRSRSAGSPTGPASGSRRGSPATS
jgi:hypothetical protein